MTHYNNKIALPSKGNHQLTVKSPHNEKKNSLLDTYLTEDQFQDIYTNQKVHIRTTNNTIFSTRYLSYRGSIPG